MAFVSIDGAPPLRSRVHQRLSDLAHARDEELAIGLRVRFFRMAMPIGPGRIGKFYRQDFEYIRLPLNLSNELGRMLRNRPLASRALCNGIEREPN